METELEYIKNFVSRWNKNEKLVASTSIEVEAIEKKLKINLPKAYKHLVTKFGDVYAPDILDSIVEKELSISDVQNFMPLNQVIGDTEAYEKAGMQKGFLAFANDCMGNLFCFKLSECVKPNIEASIWFFDHDFVEMNKIYVSFEGWLNEYNKL